MQFVSSLQRCTAEDAVDYSPAEMRRGNTKKNEGN